MSLFPSLKNVAVINITTGNRVKIGAISPGLIINSKKAIDDLIVVFPENCEDGQIMFLSFGQNFKRVSFSNGTFANGNVFGTDIKSGDSVTLFFHGATKKWYKLSSFIAPAIAKKEEVKKATPVEKVKEIVQHLKESVTHSTDKKTAEEYNDNNVGTKE